MQPSDLEIVAMLARAVSIAACASVTAALMTYLFRMRRRSGGLAGRRDLPYRALAAGASAELTTATQVGHPDGGADHVA